MNIENQTENKTEQEESKKLLSPMAGLPKHGTRWARAQISHARESLA
jgi:hypothetical protein